MPMRLSPSWIFNRVFYGWWVLFLGSMVVCVGSGILYHSFTVFFLPIKRDLAVSSAAVSLLYACARLEGGAEGPLVGYMVDRWGPRVMILMGSVLAGSGLLLLSTVQSFMGFFFVYIFIVSLGFNAGFFHPVYAAVNSWFVRHRGKGFAITGAASSIGGMIMAPFLSYLIVTYGWRTAVTISGLLILGIAVPSALPIRRTPEMMGLVPDGGPGKPAANRAGGSGVDPSGEVEFKIRDALRTLDYWLLFGAIGLRVSVTVALAVHFVPLYVWKGMSEVGSAYLISLFALGTILTTLVSGWMGDRWNKSLLCGLGVLPTIVGMLALILGGSGALLYVLPVGLAITMGIVPLNWALIGDLFGRRSYGTLRGIMLIGNGLGTFLSPIYAGWLFDRTGSYAVVLSTFIIIHVFAATLFVFLYRRSRGKRPGVQ